MSEEPRMMRYIARSYDKGSGDSWVAGDEHDMYELDPPYPLPHRQGQVGSARVDPHSLSLPEDWADYREESRVRCECRKWPTLATIMVSPSGTRWGLIQPELVPRPLQRGERPSEALALPLHAEPDGAPHVEVTSCRRCGARWLLLVTGHSIAKCRLRLVSHDQRVALDRTGDD